MQLLANTRRGPKLPIWHPPVAGQDVQAVMDNGPTLYYSPVCWPVVDWRRGYVSSTKSAGIQQCPSKWRTVFLHHLCYRAFAGLNMLPQAREFHETVGLTGLVLTKLDGTARGGAVVAVADELRVPVKYLGVGEAVADLQPFDATAFVDALLPDT